MQPGFYTVQLVGVTINGCRDTTNFVDTLKVYNFPAAYITGDSIHCTPGIYQYKSVINSIDQIHRYQWFIDGIQRSTAVDLNTNIFAGNHIVSLKVTTVNGCTDSVSKVIIVDSIQSLFSISKQKFCGDSATVAFTNNAISRFNIVRYEWDFGDNSSSTLNNPIRTYLQAGVYGVKLIVTSEHGCTDTLVKNRAIEIYKNPVPSIGGNAIQCSPGNYTYFSTATSADSIAQYQWLVNGVPAGNTDTLRHNFSPAGLYDINLKVTTNNGCAIDSFRLIIIDSVKASFTIVNSKICGDSGTVRFVNTSASRFNNMQYEWNFGDGQTSTAINPTHFYATAGNYVVTLKATTANGCSHTYLTNDTITIFKTTTASIVGEVEKCMQYILVYKPSIFTEDSITKYDWKVNSVTASTVDSLRYNFTLAGNYTISLNIQTAFGCNITTSKDVVIHPLPIPAAAPDTTICRGGFVVLRSFDGVRYQWNASSSLQNDTTATPTATPLFTSDYFLTVTNQFGCVQKDTVTVKVDVPVGLTVSSNDSICIGERIQLRANSSTASNYLWSPATGLSSTTIANPFASPSVSTLYRVIAFSSNVCKSDTATILIGVGNVPTVNAGADRNIAAGTPIQLSASVTGNDVNAYLWSPATGLSCIDCPNPNFTADNNITYKVTVQTTYGCSASDEVRIVVFCGKGQLYIPNAFSPNNDGLNDRFYIKGYGIASIKRMMIFNRYGQMVFEKQNVPVNDRSQGWDGTYKGVPAGETAAYVYVLDVICNDGQEFSYKGTIMLVK